MSACVLDMVLLCCVQQKRKKKNNFHLVTVCKILSVNVIFSRYTYNKFMFMFVYI